MERATPPQFPETNRLLGALPPNEYRRLAPHLEFVSLEAGQVLMGRREIDYVYFPTSGIIVNLVGMADGGRVEAGMVGNEGMVPLCLFLELDTTPFHVVVQNPGHALRMKAETFKAAVRPGQLLHSILLRFTACFFAQISLSAACARLQSRRLPANSVKWD